MSSRAQHYREAERLLEALPPDKRADKLAMKARVLTLEESRCTPCWPPCTMTPTASRWISSRWRKCVRGWAGMPDATSRDWLKDDDEGEP
jgi:hypothetical protein